MMKKLRRPLLLSFLFVTGFVFSGLVYFLEARLPDQRAVDRWASDGTGYAQMSVFFGSNRSFLESEVNSFRVHLSKRLEEASLKAKTEDARLWIDAYSIEASGSASLEKVNEEVWITGVKGEFFQFHPMELVSGYYFGPQEVMHDRVVIDETLAWKLFGSSDVAGRSFELNGIRCLVAGVVKNPSDGLERRVYGSKPRVYASFELIGGQETPIACYEVLIPNPVRDFGKKIVTDYLFGEVQPGEEEIAKERQRTLDVEVVENSSRFSPLELLTLVKGFPLQSMRENQVKYPYWENLARVWEYYGAVFLIAAVAAFVLPVFFTLRFLHNKWKHRKWRKELLFDWIEKKREQSWEKRRKKENEKN